MNTIRVRTSQREELRDITDEVGAAVRTAGHRRGVIHLWSVHTTCALTVNEGADPDVARDIVAWLHERIPQNGAFRHAEGNSDAHIKSSLFGPGLTLLFDDGELVLGTWQRVFLAEWDGPRAREIRALVQPA
jgi:secondary thiamine-phosphate synthase enzyme